MMTPDINFILATHVFCDGRVFYDHLYQQNQEHTPPLFM